MATDAGFGRMLPSLPPLAVEPDVLITAGREGGSCDAGGGPAETGPLSHRELGEAGWPFFGQLIAHDVTADRSTVTTDHIATSGNSRTPRLDLEMLYGDGPVGSPYMYERDDTAMLLLGDEGRDLPRNAQGIALIGDPRNDSHVFVQHLHLALLRAHNVIVTMVRDTGTNRENSYDEARTTLAWHVQWILVHQFLPLLVGEAMTEDVLSHGGQWFAPDPGQAFIPLEFSHAAYRYGHSQVRESYQLVRNGPAYRLFPDLIGFRPITETHRVTWDMLFDTPGSPPAQRARRMDGRLPASLITLPAEITGSGDADLRSLATRDLLRGRSTALPCGEEVAAAFGAPVIDLTTEGWTAGTPLWLYILKESHLNHEGTMLGPVGGRIVTEVLVGILRADATSYVSVDPGWTPTLPHRGVQFMLTDLLELGAGTVDPSIHNWIHGTRE